MSVIQQIKEHFFKEISEKEYPHFLREGAAKPRPPSKNGDILFWRSPKALD